MPFQYQQMQQDPNQLQNSQERKPELEMNLENPDDPHLGGSQEVRIKNFICKLILLYPKISMCCW